MRYYLLSILFIFSLTITSLHGQNLTYDSLLASSLGADDYGMKHP